MKNVLITGVNGFVGHHMARELKHQGHQVLGVGQQPGVSPDLVEALDQYFSVDLTNQDQVNDLPLHEVDAIISLAGLARVGDSFHNPDFYMKVNVAVVQTLCEAVDRADRHDIRHLAISTGAVYDDSQPLPLTEDARVASDASPYVLSKLAMEKMAGDYRAKGQDIVIARPFNHIGPGQEKGFLLPDLVDQVRQAVLDGTPVRVGNLETKRDYTDVRDVVRAYGSLVLAGSLDQSLFNICSGKSLAGRKLLEMVIEQLAHDKKPQVVADPNKFRPTDAPNIYGSYERLHAATGWSPSIPIEKTVAEFIFGPDAASSAGLDRPQAAPSPII